MDKLDGPVVGMVEHNGRVFVATTRCIYEFKDEGFTPLAFVNLTQEEDTNDGG